jgi:ABC-type sugar transport system ATPase subunit
LDLTIAKGEIHALVGENGAGKSTCLGVLAGRIEPDAGTLQVFGDEVRGFTPRSAHAAGVVAIYQELTIVPALSAHANVFLGQTLSRHGMLSERQMRRRYLELCRRLGVPAAPAKAEARSLSVADQQLLEIMRAIVAESQVILFDEPTTALSLPERDALRRLMLDLRAEGLTLVFVSHNLEEVLQVADTVSVFRDGRRQLTAPRSELTKRTLVEAMLGDAAGERLAEGLLEEADGQPAPDRPRREQGKTLLKVDGLTVPGAVSDVSFDLRAGEIFGFGGLMGSGRTTVLRALAGLEPRAQGRLWVDDREVRWPRSVRRARALGIALSPEDRKTEGLALQMSAMDNIALADLSGVASGPFLSRRRMRDRCADVAAAYGFDRRRIAQAVSGLSGGNQQKVLLSRWGFAPPRVLLADEPTRGVDIGAKEEILAALELMATTGTAIVIVSSELEELATLCDRILVLTGGKKSGLLEREHTGVAVPQIIEHAFGVDHAV